MKRLHRLLMAVGAAAAALAASPYALAQVEAKSAWVRATAGGQKTAGAYLELKSARDAALVGVESSAAQIAEVHEMRMDGNVMRMRAVARLELPAGATVELKPGGYHVMLNGVKGPLKKGDRVPLKLRFEHPDKSMTTLEVTAEVRDAAAARGH